MIGAYFTCEWPLLGRVGQHVVFEALFVEEQILAHLALQLLVIGSVRLHVGNVVKLHAALKTNKLRHSFKVVLRMVIPVVVLERLGDRILFVATPAFNHMNNI